ncbi:MAG: helix-turn-helix transcriptional regulator [Treponema sp.]|nr:helix-turn-helix transcriptional regulator [Treponema sp.]
MNELKPETINYRIKLLRDALGMTQANFSRVISLSSGYLAGVETEKRTVNNRIVKLICSSFSVSEEWLRTGQGEMFLKEEDPKFSRLLNLYKELSPNYRDFIFRQIELLLKIQDEEEPGKKTTVQEPY